MDKNREEQKKKSLIDIQKDFTQEFFYAQEHTRKHNPYDQEIREYTSIRNGDLEQLERSKSETYEGHEGILAKDPLRSAKNMAIVIITLSCRAAIEGGLHYEIGYSLSDSFINTVEDMNTPEEAVRIAREAQHHYTKLVHEIKSFNKQAISNGKLDVRVTKCRNYIFTHLHDKIKITDIAKDLYINPNYLSYIFKECEGMTIGEFVLTEKIKLVKNMLIYSQYSFIEIATYLSFSSQSHLGKQFKKQTGMTLREYRETYQVSN